MTYRIAGLDPADFAPLWAMDEAELARRGARRVTSDADRGFPCRVTLEDARAGEELLLVTRGDARLDNQKSKAAFGGRPRMLGAEDVLRLTSHQFAG